MDVHKWHRETLGKTVVAALKKNMFDAVYFSTREEAVAEVLKYIIPGITIGVGGSATVSELGIPEKAEAMGAKVLSHHKHGLSLEEMAEIRRQQLLSDVFLCSSNAITLDGYLVNVDRSGNRVAAMTFGPKKVVVVAGTNKICQDEQAADERIRRIAAPANNKRLDMKNPCAATGVCSDCQGKDRLCRIYSVMKRRPMNHDITVIIVGEDLGY
ncbi:MAG: lactate utilization protein [Dehalobacterium sp.]